jgi:hypothetical protein
MRHRRAGHPVAVVALAAAGAVAAVTVPASGGGPQQSPYLVEIARAEQAMNELQSALLAKLKAAMDGGGPAAAVEVCRTDARTIADAVARKQGIELGRTSHRLRNPANAPRPWARVVVEGSSAAKASSEQIRIVDLGDRVGVLRPIGTAEACTRCHGAADEVRRHIGATLAAAYPEDRATGFAAGDLRGWMWAEVPKAIR